MLYALNAMASALVDLHGRIKGISVNLEETPFL